MLGPRTLGDRLNFHPRGSTILSGRCDREDVTVRGYGDIAIMHGRVRMEMDADGKPRSMHNCFAAVWAKRDGRWRLIHFQPTPVPAT